ncbi:MAG: glycosyltransferase family 2 protein [Treponema sp.]|nr:glycosyltransferase family 2 protein [Treponema sp.]
MLTTSIVLYNTPRSQINAVMKSVIDSSSVHILYIIDNSLNDKWRILEKEYSDCGVKIRYIHNANLGYGSSHNLAMQEAIEEGSDYHVVLNPDIYFEARVLPELVDYMDSNTDVGYILPRVTYPNGDLQYLCKLLPTPFDLIFRRFLPRTKSLMRHNERYELRHSGYDKIMNPPCLSGCFMFMRLSTLKENNMFFDEKYFMYCEDFDLMRRIHSIAKTIYYPKVSIVHNHAKESYKNRKMLMTHIKSAIKYFNKFGWFFDKERNLINKKILKEIDEMNTVSHMG